MLRRAVSDPASTKATLETLKTQIAKHEKLKAEAEEERKNADIRINSIVEFMNGM
jgi:hypothetical protein